MCIVGAMERLSTIIQNLSDFWKRRGTAAKVMIVLALCLVYSAGNRAMERAGWVDKQPVIVEASAPKSEPEPVAVGSSAPSPLVVVRGYLRQTLNDWDSYEDVSFSEPEIVEHKGKNVYHVVHRYRAKNGLGALRLVEQDFYYTHGGELVDASKAR